MTMHLKTVIDRGGQTFLVSTVYATLFPVGWETLVFRCEPDGTVHDYIDLAAARYASQDEARKGHDNMVATFQVN